MNTIFGMILVLGVMILVHEWGHFIVARLFGVRVDVFSIGFGPRLFGWKRGDTDYRVSALPFGGYVRMAGQDPSEIDSADREWFSKSAEDKTKSDATLTREAAEFRGVERIERDIDAPDAAIRQFAGVTGELRAVGRQREFVKRAARQMPRQSAEERHYAAPHQRLAAGDA